MPVLGKTKQEVLSAFRSSEILEAAQKVFARRGFSGATVEEIAGAAKVAKGTLYLYFPSKRAIYLAAFRQGIEALHQRTSEKFAAAGTLEKKIQTFVETRVRYFDENRDFFKIYYSELGNVFGVPNHLSKDLNAMLAEQAGMLEAALAAGAERGEVRPIPARATAFAIYDLTRGLVARRLTSGAKNCNGEAAFLLDLLWKGIAKR